ncbi:MAG: lysophospholipid acyltransferase family protein [bacterium]
MNVLNRTRVLGRENLRHLEPPFIIMSNHLTLLDDLFLGPFLFWPRCLFGYRYLPYHAPEERNFYKVRIIAWFMKHTKSIPVIRGKGIYQEGVERMIDVVRKGGILHIHPEGTRSRTGEVYPPKPGIGRIVFETQAPVVPVYHQGLESVLPIGSGFPHFGKEIRISIGKPLLFSQEFSLPNDPSTWTLIAEQIINGIKKQKELLDATWGPKPVKVKPAIYPARTRSLSSPTQSS